MSALLQCGMRGVRTGRRYGFGAELPLMRPTGCAQSGGRPDLCDSLRVEAALSTSLPEWPEPDEPRQLTSADNESALAVELLKCCGGGLGLS
jgi:hypothetical protein